MNNREYIKLLRKVAKQQGVPVEEVRREIDTALKFAQTNPNLSVQAKLANVPRKGDAPTAPEIISYFAKEVKKDSDED